MLVVLLTLFIIKLVIINMVSCYFIFYKIYSITRLLQNAENVEFNEICLAISLTITQKEIVVQ